MATQPDLDRLYREGVAAIRAGDNATGRQKLMQVVEHNQVHEQAWLWLSAVVETDDEKILCLENVLTVNPGNEAARRGLERLGVTPSVPLSAEPKPEPKPVLMEHGASSAVDGDTDAVLTGDLDDLGKAETVDPGEAWRAQMLEKYAVDYAGMSDGTLIPALEEAPPRSLGELTKAWLAALTFRVYGPYKEEVTAADVRHIAVNLLVISVLQIMAGIIPAVVLFFLLDGDFESFLEPLAQFLEDVGQFELAQLLPPQLHPIIKGMRLARVGRLGAQVRQTAPQIPDSFGLMLAGYAFAAVALAFIGQMYRAIVTSSIASWFSHKGNVMQTMHALTIALVAAWIVQFPVAVIAPFLPFALVMWLWVVVQIWRIALAAVALKVVYEFEFFFALGALGMSAVVLGLTVGVLVSLPLLLPG